MKDLHRPHRWSRAALFLALAQCPGLIAGAQAPEPQAKDQPGPDPVVRQLIEAHNKERDKEGKSPLIFEAKLQEAAMIQAKDMAGRGSMGHEGSDGSTPTQRIIRVDYHFLLAGENVARGYQDVAEVMQGWMDSPPHRKNVMGDFSEIGVARVTGKDGKFYWCAEFGKPMPKLVVEDASTSVIRRINEERSAAKQTTLVLDPRLAKAAQSVAADLAKNRGQGGTPKAFHDIDVRLYRDLAMTTSGGQPDAVVLIKSLMENPNYKARLLGKYSKIGVGYATAEDGLPHWCIILGLSASR